MSARAIAEIIDEQHEENDRAIARVRGLEYAVRAAADALSAVLNAEDIREARVSARSGLREIEDLIRR